MSKLKTTQTTNYQFDKITCEQNPNMAFKDYVIVDNNDNWAKADEAIKSVEDGVTTNKADLVNVKSDIVEIKERIKEGIKGDRGQSAYEVAVEEGFIGTVEEWLKSLKGEQGEIGNGWLFGAADPLPTYGKDGDLYIQTTSYDIFKKKNGEWVEAGNIKGVKGDRGEAGQNGREIELRRHETHVQYKYAGEPDTAWRNVIALESITGPKGEPGEQGTPGQNGKNVELQKTETHIQWKHNGESQWNNLVELNTLKGAQGNAGLNGREIELKKSDTHIQYRYVGEGEQSWQNVVALQDIKGATGERGLQGVAGVNGKNIELQKSSTHIQWRVTGEGSWNDLVALSDLKGDKGDPGEGSAGEVCVLKINGVLPAGNGEVYLYPEDLGAVDIYTFEQKALGETLTLTPKPGYVLSEQKNYKKEKEAYINFKISNANTSVDLPSGSYVLLSLPFMPKGANNLVCHYYNSRNSYVSSEQIALVNGSDVSLNLKSDIRYAYISGTILI